MSAARKLRKRPIEFSTEWLKDFYFYWVFSLTRRHKQHGDNEMFKNNCSPYAFHSWTLTSQQALVWYNDPPGAESPSVAGAEYTLLRPVGLQVAVWVLTLSCVSLSEDASSTLFKRKTYWSLRHVNHILLFTQSWQGDELSPGGRLALISTLLGGRGGANSCW